jgi:hypothetical protein
MREVKIEGQLPVACGHPDNELSGPPEERPAARQTRVAAMATVCPHDVVPSIAVL